MTNIGIVMCNTQFHITTVTTRQILIMWIFVVIQNAERTSSEVPARVNFGRN